MQIMSGHVALLEGLIKAFGDPEGFTEKLKELRDAQLAHDEAHEALLETQRQIEAAKVELAEKQEAHNIEVSNFSKKLQEVQNAVEANGRVAKLNEQEARRLDKIESDLQDRKDDLDTLEGKLSDAEEKVAAREEAVKEREAKAEELIADYNHRIDLVKQAAA